MIIALTIPTVPELIQAIPVIISLIVIEGLLSVDNALAIAAMAKHLPGKQKYLALKYGILGAYHFRGLCMWGAAWIIANTWLKIVGPLILCISWPRISVVRRMRMETTIPKAAANSAGSG